MKILYNLLKKIICILRRFKLDTHHKENYQTSRIVFNELDKLELEHDKLNELEIFHNNRTYFMKINLEKESDKLVIFSNGAIDPKKNIPPIYMRSSWANEINASTIFLDDPTLLGTDMRLGWGQGEYGDFALESISQILNKILERFNIEYKNTYFYGSSAGGYMSMYYTLLLPGTKTIVNNPQTNVLSYTPSYVKRMLRHSYKINEINEVPEELMYKLNLVKAIQHYDVIPDEIYYIQNYCCESDMELHLTPFINDLNKSNINMSNILLLNYFHKGLGHNPLPKKITIKYINQIINNKLELNFIKN